MSTDDWDTESSIRKPSETDDEDEEVNVDNNESDDDHDLGISELGAATVVTSDTETKPGPQSTWSKEMLVDLVDIIVNNDSFLVNLVKTNGTKQTGRAT